MSCYYLDGNAWYKGIDMISIKKEVVSSEISNLELYAYEFRQTNHGINYDFLNELSAEPKYVLDDGEYSVVTSDFADNVDIVSTNGNNYYLFKECKLVSADGFLVILNQLLKLMHMIAIILC